MNDKKEIAIESVLMDEDNRPKVFQVCLFVVDSGNNSVIGSYNGFRDGHHHIIIPSFVSRDASDNEIQLVHGGAYFTPINISADAHNVTVEVVENANNNA